MNAVDLKQRQTIDLGNGVSMVFCFIPNGEFRMGSRSGQDNEQPVHRVIIAEAFWLGETPVTQQQYACFNPDHRSHFHGKPDNPVEEVDWHQARKFCGWLTQAGAPRSWPDELAELQPELPTETQWEYACCAGTDTDYYTGDGEQALTLAGWYGEGWDIGGTHPAGQKAPNAFGLYDMHGNVWEWCRDLWREDAYRHRAEDRIEPVNAGDPVTEKDERRRVIRGGAWVDHPNNCRSAYRVRVHPGSRVGDQGFRVGLFPGPSCPVK